MSKNKLSIRLEGSTDKFVNYLKDFAKINSDLLLEIDPFNKQFIAKTFSPDRSAIRFSAVTFDDCGMLIEEHTRNSQVNVEDNYRIKLGILQHLPKMIKIIERFQDSKKFNIIINYDFLKDSSDTVTDCAAENIQFSSDTLTMKMDGFRISEFKYLPDDVFNNRISKIDNPVLFPISAISISNIIKTSDIIKIDSKKDALVFYVDGKDVYVKDLTSKDGKGRELPSNFTYKLGTLPTVLNDAIRLVIFRERFIQMFDKTVDDYNILFGKSIDGAVDRLVMDSTTSNTKIVISIVNED